MRPSNVVDKQTETYEIDPSKFSKILSRVLSEKNLEDVNIYPTINLQGSVTTLHQNNKEIKLDEENKEIPKFLGDSTNVLLNRTRM